MKRESVKVILTSFLGRCVELLEVLGGDPWEGSHHPLAGQVSRTLESACDGRLHAQLALPELQILLILVIGYYIWLM